MVRDGVLKRKEAAEVLVLVSGLSNAGEYRDGAKWLVERESLCLPHLGTGCLGPAIP